MTLAMHRHFGRKAILQLIGAALLFAAWAGPTAAADKFPSKPIKLVSPYSAGGTADVLARALADGMSKALGQTVFVENKGGGSGAVGGMIVANAEPDGYTLYLGGLGGNVVLPMLENNKVFLPAKQLTPVSLVASYQQIIVASATSPVNTLNDLIAAAKSRAGLTYGTSGVTTSNYLGTEILMREADFPLIHVPYKGEAPTLQDLIGGQLDLANVSVSFAEPYIRAGKIKAIVTMYPTRVKSLPNVPSITEFYPRAGVDPWFGLYTTARTPAAVVNVLNAAARAALTDKAIAASLEQRGFIVRPSQSVAEFAKFMASETNLWQMRLKKAKLTRVE